MLTLVACDATAGPEMEHSGVNCRGGARLPEKRKEKSTAIPSPISRFPARGDAARQGGAKETNGGSRRGPEHRESTNSPAG